MVLEIKQNKVTYKKALGELQDGAAQLQVLMKKIATNEWVLTSRFVPISDRRGRLAWPVGGKIITRFGPETHPRFKTTIMNKGIDIAPFGKSVPVQAVHAGKVVYADYFYGYGNLLIIDHGPDLLFTLRTLFRVPGQTRRHGRGRAEDSLDRGTPAPSRGNASILRSATGPRPSIP